MTNNETLTVPQLPQWVEGHRIVPDARVFSCDIGIQTLYLRKERRRHWATFLPFFDMRLLTAPDLPSAQLEALRLVHAALLEGVKVTGQLIGQADDGWIMTADALPELTNTVADEDEIDYQFSGLMHVRGCIPMYARFGNMLEEDYLATWDDNRWPDPNDKEVCNVRCWRPLPIAPAKDVPVVPPTAAAGTEE